MWGDETPTVKEGNFLLLETKFPQGGSRQENFAIPSGATQAINKGISGHDTGDVPKHKTYRNNLSLKTGQFPSSRKWALSTDRVNNMFSTRNPLRGNGSIATGQINTKTQPYQAGSGLPDRFTLIGKETRRQKSRLDKRRCNLTASKVASGTKTVIKVN